MCFLEGGGVGWGVIICLGINAHLLNTTNATARVQPGRTTGVWEHVESLRALRCHGGDKILTGNAF